MDANGARFWMCSDVGDWVLGDGAAWDSKRRVLHLGSRRTVKMSGQDRASARMAADGVRGTVDAYGTWAVIASDGKAVTAAGAFPQPVVLYRVEETETVRDAAVGPEGILWLIVEAPGGGRHVVMTDVLERWQPVSLSRPDIQPDRILARPQGGAWALDRRDKIMARIDGVPFPEYLFRSFSPHIGRPCVENPDPPVMGRPIALPVPDTWELVAAAAASIGHMAFLFWTADGDARVVLWDETRFFPPDILSGLAAPFSIGWVGESRWAVVVEHAGHAPVFRLPTEIGAVVDPVGDYYPLPGWNGGPLCNTLHAPVHYVEKSADESRENPKPRPLHRLSQPGLVKKAAVHAARPFDSGSPKTVWHRLYLEGTFPPGTGVRLRLAVSDHPDPPPQDRFVPFHFATVPDLDLSPLSSSVPKGSWVPFPSEIPFHQGFLDCPRQRDRSGLFTVLVQRPGTRVRSLQGRFLWLVMDLFGTGQAGPEVAAVRVYAPRFSYRDRYLPDLYKETLSGSEADAAGPPSGPDFLERFLCLFEGCLTPMEDRVAAAHGLTDPDVAPFHALAWLSSWFGLTLEPALSEQARRRLIREAMTLFRSHGTLKGLRHALDIATDGGIAQGRIAVVEDFRLRRTFATILGADLPDEEDPLTAGMTASGNSILGRSLFLGAEEEREFLALFRPRIAEGAEQEAVVAALFDQFAHRVTVLVRRDTPEAVTALVRLVASRETPAHVETRVVAASENLVVGIASLVAVDTALEPRPPLRPVTENRSRLSRDATVLDTLSLDPRLG
uniref:Phage tail protein n=1 Tax=Desulfacinum infernum TaxID=35837 RepID=A0A832A0P7_9BACT